MKFHQSLTLILLIFCPGFSAVAQNPKKFSAEDFAPLIGYWKGTLTYLDYSTGKPYTMPADLDIKRIGNSSGFSFSNIYPDEPQANSTDTLTISISARHKTINQETVKKRKQLPDGSLQIITQETGTDGNDNKPAIFKYTYFISSTKFVKTKEVKFVGGKGWVKRHEYRYGR